MKLKLSLIVALLSIGGIVNAQDEDTSIRILPGEKHKMIEHQVGINASNFVLTFISFNQGFIGQNNPFLVNYRAIYLTPGLPIKGAGIRMAYGGNNSSSNSESIVNQTTSSFNSKVNDWRVGVEVQKDFGKRWMGYYGIDYIGGRNMNFNKTTTTGGGTPFTTETETETFYRGWGMALGVQFHLNKYMSLGTATRMIATNQRFQRIRNNSNPQFVPEVTRTDSESATIQAPLFVNFLIRF